MSPMSRFFRRRPEDVSVPREDERTVEIRETEVDPVLDDTVAVHRTEETVQLEPVAEETVRIRRTEETVPAYGADPVDPTLPLRAVEEPAPVAGRRVEEVVERRPVVREVPPRRPVLWPYLLALLVLVLGGLAALYFLAREDDPETRPVPSVVRLQLDDAVDRLTADGFRPDSVQRPNAAPSGTVFAQDPSAGTELEEGSRVQVLVSRGPATAPVPNVVGLPLQSALQRLDTAGLGARQVGVLSEEPPNTVIAQEPGGGERAPRGSKIRINVSRGTGRVTVPNVTGQSSDDAGANIRKAGLEARVVNVPSAEPEGTVIAQNPPAGGELGRGQFVRINVSTGAGAGAAPAPATTAATAPATTAPATTSAVPDVGALDEAAARSDLEAAGFTVRVQSEATDDASLEGFVIRQQPVAGAAAGAGAPVTIVVGQSSP